MVANIRGYTPNYSFKLINFDTPRWHTLEYANWNMVDAMFLQSGTPQMRGGWQNNTLYLEGDRVFDEETSASYRCLIEHTSPELGTFGEFRTLNPTYWSLQLGGTPVYRGEWQPGVTYVLGDIVYIDQYEYFLCTMANVSSGAFPPDATKWQTIFDATQVVTDAEAAKGAAYQFSLDAQQSAADALESENNAETAEEGAENWADDARAAGGAFRWAFSTGTAAVDPAAGRVAFNTANPTTVSEIYISAQSAEAGNPDVSAWIETWDDSTNPTTRGTVQIRKVGAPEQFLLFNVTNNIIDGGSWLRVPVGYVSHSGSLANAEPVGITFVRAGNVGPTGTGGGDMLSTNNLNDVASIPTSRNNLGLGVAQIPTFSQVLLTAPPTVATHAATKEYVDASPSLFVGDTQPPLATTQDGSLWWDSDKGTLFLLYNDGNSRQWVQAVAVPGLDTTGLVKKSGDVMSGALSINGVIGVPLEIGNGGAGYQHSQMRLTALKGGGTTGAVQIIAAVNNVQRWLWSLADSTNETGANTGSNFILISYDDAGGQIGAPLRIERATGRVTVENDPATPLGVATKQYVDANAGFAAGTLMLFQQTNAPTGWTKETGYNDYAMRLVSGGVTAGGVQGFSTVFNRTSTDAFTPSVTYMAYHAHYGTPRSIVGYGYSADTGNGYNFINPDSNVTNGEGGGAGFAMGIDLRVKYIDFILARKN